MKCPNCGQELSDQARFCRFCGQRLEQKPTPQPPEPPKRSEPEIIPRWQPRADTENKTGLGQKKIVWVIAALALLLVVIVGALVFLIGKNKVESKQSREESAISMETSYEED